MDTDAENFIRDLEEKRGGKVTWRTFSTFYANSKGLVRDHGVFLYEVNERFWYEDFEPSAKILGIPIGKSKHAKPYVKYEDSFGPEEVKSIRKVSKKAALAYCTGHKSYEKLRPANRFCRLFCQCVTEFALKDGTVLFFELMDNTLVNKIKL